MTSGKLILRRALTTACVKIDGTELELRQLLINVKRQGPIALKDCLNITVGMMSSVQFVDFIC